MPAPTAQSFLLTQLPAEPRPGGSAASGDRLHGLTDEVFASAVGRVRIAALLSGAIWTSVVLANVAFSGKWSEWAFAGTAGWPHPNWIYGIAGAIGSFALAWGIGRYEARPRTILDL